MLHGTSRLSNTGSKRTTQVQGRKADKINMNLKRITHESAQWHQIQNRGKRRIVIRNKMDKKTENDKAKEPTTFEN